MTDDDWIKPRTAKAKEGRPLITEPVLARTEDLLNGQLSERKLSKGDITRIAKELITDMIPTPPRAEAKQ